jgi:hypothetical protein
LHFTPLPFQHIHPQGWLKAQLRTQAAGLSGHLDLFWPDVQRSRWFGGDAEGWERAPYWLDGVIPLAALLDDGAPEKADLVQRIHGHIDDILARQEEDGWLGPRQMNDGVRQVTAESFHDVWSQFLIGKVLTQYADWTGDERILPALQRNLRCLLTRIGPNPLFNWALFRWFEPLLTIFWVYERQPEDWLLELAVKLNAQGFHWKEYFQRWPETRRIPTGVWTYASHVVNNALAVKSGALWARLSGDESDAAFSLSMIEQLEKYHGSLAGIFSGDECLAGKDPTQGTELCAVVDYAFSLEVLLSLLGEPGLGDRLEKDIFNALPATLTPDMWCHQYDQQINQIECSIRPRDWTNNKEESNIFGLEPNYGCCTANFSQGWPKFAASLWMHSAAGTPDEGLAAAAYAPVRLETRVRGVPVSIDVETGYPFRETITIKVNAAKPLRFPLALRIPAWADGAVCQVRAAAHSPRPGSFFTIDQEWRPGEVVTLALPMRPRLVQHDGASVSIERGPLVYALGIAEERRQVHADDPVKAEPHADWELYPRSTWNYALKVTPETLAQDLTFTEQPLGDLPFSPEGAPVTASVQAAVVESWQAVEGNAGPLPQSPVADHGALETVKLIPYGCTNLRIAQFPTID